MHVVKPPALAFNFTPVQQEHQTQDEFSFHGKIWPKSCRWYWNPSVFALGKVLMCFPNFWCRPPHWVRSTCAPLNSAKSCRSWAFHCVGGFCPSTMPPSLAGFSYSNFGELCDLPFILVYSVYWDSKDSLHLSRIPMLHNEKVYLFVLRFWGCLNYQFSFKQDNLWNLAIKAEGFCIFCKNCNSNVFLLFLCSEKRCVKHTLLATKSLHHSLYSTRLLTFIICLWSYSAQAIHINSLLSKMRKKGTGKKNTNWFSFATTTTWL